MRNSFNKKLKILQNGDLLKFLREHKQRSREPQNQNTGMRLSAYDLTKCAYQVNTTDFEES